MDTLDMVSGPVAFAQQLQEHSEKVHAGVELIQPLVDALLAEDRDKTGRLRKQLSEIRDEADRIRLSLYDQIKDMHFRATDAYAFSQYLACQQGIVDASEDLAGLLAVRRTTVPIALRPDLQAFVVQTVSISRQIIRLAEGLSSSAEDVPADVETADVSDVLEAVTEGCRQARRLATDFAQHLHALDGQLNPMTVMFLDKCCTALKEVVNNAERTASHLRLMA